MASPWAWSASARRYRNTETGRFIGRAEMLALRDTYADAKRAMARELAQRLADGDVGLGAWQQAMRQDVKRSFIDQYVLGHGGRGSMTQADWGRVGRMIRDQYAYLENFARDIATGAMTAAQIAARATLYHGASTQAFEAASARAHGVTLRLPAYPGDGSTQCLTNCRCHWDIQEADGGHDCYWIVDPGAESCPDCLERGAAWAPYEVRA